MDRLGDEPHQPRDFPYPKRQFGKTKVVSRPFQSAWFGSFPWLHYDEGTDSAFCFTCSTAVRQKKILSTNSSKMDGAFVSTGFSNWKDATVSFRKHESSECHRAATELTITLPSQVKDIGESLSKMHSEEKADNRALLLKILGNIRFLARQGLALRGHGGDDNSNFIQLLKLRGDDDQRVATWMEKKVNRFISPKIQNELIEIMALRVLREVVRCIQRTPFFTVMMDETTDATNKEQVVIVLRWVDDGFSVHEDFIGLYVVETIQASMLAEILKDTLMRLNLSVKKVRGQCYDGASTMAGCRSGLAKRLRDEEPRAVYTHCYGHSLSLAAGDAVKGSAVMKSALEVTHEVTKLVKFSPRRDALFQQLKKELAPDTIGIRVLCPTRWTVRAEALSSILANYQVLISLWEEAKTVVRDTEVIARINGVSSCMEKFAFIFGVVLGRMILGHTDNLSKSLQVKTLSAAEGQKQAKLTTQTLQSIRSDEMYELFWLKVTKLAEDLDADPPILPRRRKRPKKYDQGSAEPEYPESPKASFRASYFEALDLAINSIVQRFDQPGFEVYRNLQEIVIKAARRQNFEAEYSFVCSFYGDDINPTRLRVQLELLGTNFRDAANTEITFQSVVELLKSLQHQDYLSEVITIVKLTLVMPATNASSERAFSSLRRVKTYLRSTMTQPRLNHLLILSAHSDKTDLLSLRDVANDFVAIHETRLSLFGKF